MVADEKGLVSSKNAPDLKRCGADLSVCSDGSYPAASKHLSGLGGAADQDVHRGGTGNRSVSY